MKPRTYNRAVTVLGIIAIGSLLLHDKAGEWGGALIALAVLSSLTAAVFYFVFQWGAGGDQEEVEDCSPASSSEETLRHERLNSHIAKQAALIRAHEAAISKALLTREIRQEIGQLLLELEKQEWQATATLRLATGRRQRRDATVRMAIGDGTLRFAVPNTAVESSEFVFPRRPKHDRPLHEFLAVAGS